MRRFRLWLARKLIPDANIFVRTPNSANVAGFTTLTGCTFTNASTDAVWYAKADRMFKYEDGEITEVDMGKKKKRSKAAGKAAAKNKQENKQKAKGGKGAR